MTLVVSKEKVVLGASSKSMTVKVILIVLERIYQYFKRTKKWRRANEFPAPLNKVHAYRFGIDFGSQMMEIETEDG